MYARVAEFYGWTHLEISNLEYKTFLKYWRAIVPIEAERTLLDMKIAAYPNMKPQDQRSFFKSTQRKISNSIERPKQGLKSYADVIGSIKAKVNG